MKKIAIIINGAGGVGKDTLCDIAAKYFKVTNVSSITPIKEIARNHGWNGEKDARSRKFLSDLKRVFIDYNNLPTNYLYEQYKSFMDSDSEVYFAHIREGEEIDKLHKHEYSDTWSADETHHWKECTAEGCPEDEKKTDYGEHVYQKGACRVCDALEPGYVEALPKTGDHSGLFGWMALCAMCLSAAAFMLGRMRRKGTN